MLLLAIVDDDPNDSSALSALVAEYFKKNNRAYMFRVFNTSMDFIRSTENYDIVFMDIRMDQLDGLEGARIMRKINTSSALIFVTHMAQLAIKGYEVDALHYLTKPLSAEKLTQVLSKAADKLSVEPPSVVISCDGETLKLYESDILYAEAFLHYIVIHTKDNEYKIKEPISVFENKVSDDFYRIHRSYLVSLKYITRISRTSVTIGNSTLPLSRGKYDDINRAFIEHN